MRKSLKFSPEVIERAVRMVFDAKDQYPSQWAALESIASKIGCTGETLRKWVRQGERDSGVRPGPTTAEQQRIKELEREVRVLWAQQWRRCEVNGDMIVVRYADDLVVGFEHEAEARRFWDAMRTRFEQFSLELHGEKTRLLEFGRYAIERRQRNGQGKPQTFNFLGFTFICGRSRRGAFLLRRHTRRDRMRAALGEIKDEMRRRRHDSLADQGRKLRSVVAGYFAYHAVPTNAHAIGAYRHYVIELWRRSLKRRSQKDRMTWARIDRLANEWLPPPHVLHPWPEDRFAVSHPR